MRKVILAAALAVTFTLPLRIHAQQAGGASSGGAIGGAQAGPPTTGSFSVQGQSQGTLGDAGQPGGLGGTGGAGQGSMEVGSGQTLYGPSGQSGGTDGAGGAGDAGAGEASAAGAGGTGATGAANARPPTTVGAASEDPQVEIARLQAEVERLRAELNDVKAGRAQGGTGTGGSGEPSGAQAQPLASAVFEGRVRNVSKKAIEVIDRETGEPYVLLVNQGTRVRSGEQRIPVTRLREGSEVRASFELLSGDTYATQIEVLRKGRR